MTTCVDLNCDMGESFGAFVIGQDHAVMQFVTSANIACGFHGGDPSVMHRTVRLAAEHGVAIGAHPGLPDLVGFGRRSMAVTPTDVRDMVVYQIGALQAIAATAGQRVRHVKPHGALYNMACANPELADAIARAARDVDPTLLLVGLSGSALIDAGTACGLRTVSEVFADRGYLQTGMLVSRDQPQALITDAGIAAARVVDMVKTGNITAVDGTRITVRPETVCIHGDAPGAATLAAAIRQALRAAQIDVAAPHTSSQP
jgi:5-oxoprolinase (ATP-hydrolysing) subunit A